VRRKFAIGFLVLVAILVIAWVALSLAYPVRFTYDAKLPLNAQVEFNRDFETCNQYRVAFDSINGQRVPALLCLPKDATPPYPCVILLHGLGQDKDLIDEIHPQFMLNGYAMICIDSQYRGERKRPGKSFISLNMFETRHTFAQTIVDARRCVDFLQTQEEINPYQIVLVGASMGGILGTTVTAYEPRVKATVLLYAGGNLERLLAESTILYPQKTWWRSAFAWISGVIIRQTDPARHIGKISPRPVLMINGRHDTVVPLPCAEELFAAAREPKESIWHDTDHIGLDGRELVDTCIDESIAWFNEVLGRRTETAAVSDRM